MKSPNEFTKAYSQSVRKKDVEAFSSLYSENIRIFDHWDDWSLRGIQACRQMATEWFSSLGTEYVQVDFSEVELIENANVAFLSCFVRFAGHGSDGQQLRFLDERMTVALHKLNNGQWKVLHQHTSSPASLSDMKIKTVRA